MHSYGGVVGGEAIKGLPKSASDPRKPGVVKLIYICSFVMPANTFLSQGSPDGSQPYFNRSEDRQTLYPPTLENCRTVFYSDVGKETSESLVRDLTSIQTATFQGRTTWEAYREIDSAYVYCHEDPAIPIQRQQAMTAFGGITKTFDLQAGHCPFISLREQTAKIVLAAIAA